MNKTSATFCLLQLSFLVCGVTMSCLPKLCCKPDIKKRLERALIVILCCHSQIVIGHVEEESSKEATEDNTPTAKETVL